jgi:LptA/(LptD N-terminal domain) LPS transport protein
MSFVPTPTSRKKNPLLWLTALAAAGVAGYYGFHAVNKIVREDPLKALKQTRADELPETVAIEMKNSQFRHYEKGVPQTSCDVVLMRIAQNRQMYTLEGISKGVISWKNKNYKFEAEHGTWNGFTKQMALNGKLRLAGAQFNLTSDSFNYDENQKLLRLPNPVKGKAIGGDLVVANFEYSLEKESFKAGKGSWQGVPDKKAAQEAGVDPGKTAWKVEFDESKHSKDITTYTTARATDNDVIIKAPKIEVNNKTDVLTATGRVRYFSGKANLIADKVVVYRKEKRAVLSGNVTMLVKPKEAEAAGPAEIELTPLPPVVPESISSTRPPAPDNEDTKRTEEEIRSSKNLRKYPLSLTSNQIEYWYKKGERRAKITGSPQARQELPEGWRYVWAGTALFDVEKDLLTLESAPGKTEVVLKNSLGDELFGVWGQLSTKEDDDEYSFKKGKGKISTRDEEDGGTPPPAKSGSGGLSGPIGQV